MMEYYFQRQYFSLFFFFLLCSGFLSSSSAYKFSADGNQGWRLNDSANNQWAGEYRFLINDIIVFNFTNGSDSVLVVKNKTDYDNCNNKTNTVKKLGDGDEFRFDRHGPFYFISEKNCTKGQRMIVVVLSPRNAPETAQETRWVIKPAILLVGSASLLVLVLLIVNKKKKK